MKRSVFIIISCLLMATCFGQTQGEMNKDAANRYKNADKELNSVYQKILATYKGDTAFLKNFQAAQRLWVRFRDAEVKAKYPDREAGYYGSAQPMCRFDYLTKLINERIKTLRVWLDGMEEGDVCSGSVKSKQ